MEITDELEFLARPRKKPKGNKPLDRISLRETAEIRLFFVSRRIPFIRLAKVLGVSDYSVHRWLHEGIPVKWLAGFQELIGKISAWEKSTGRRFPGGGVDAD
jgi:hypothetical protein